MESQAMVVVDASVWVARLVPEDVFHKPAREWMAAQRAANILLVSPSLLLPEVAGAISRRTGRDDLAAKAIMLIQQVPGVRLVEMDQTLVASAAHLAGLLGLRGADSVYVATAAYLNLPLYTLDEDQARRAAYQVRVVERKVS